MERIFRVAILANGERPTGAALALFVRADALVACDGALVAARALGREPDWVVGDGDSLAETNAVVPDGRFVRMADQDSNDLDKALRFALSRWSDARVLHVLGAGGGRDDHLIGNAFRLPEYAAPGRELALVTGTGRFDALSAGDHAFSCRRGDDVSVFAPFAGTDVASDGLAWPLSGVDLSRVWRGTLNRTTGDSFRVRSTAPILVYRAGFGWFHGA